MKRKTIAKILRKKFNHFLGSIDSERGALVLLLARI